MRELTKNQEIQLHQTFNSSAVRSMSKREYRDYIQCILTLSLGTVLAEEGVKFTAEFVQAALNNSEDIPIVQQVKKH